MLLVSHTDDRFTLEIRISNATIAPESFVSKLEFLALGVVSRVALFFKTRDGMWL